MQSQNVQAMNKCTVKASVKENIDGCKSKSKSKSKSKKSSLYFRLFSWIDADDFLSHSLGLDRLPGMAM